MDAACIVGLNKLKKLGITVIQNKVTNSTTMSFSYRKVFIPFSYDTGIMQTGIKLDCQCCIILLQC